MSKYYVTATDTFMSGWGYAKNRISKMVAVCEDYKTADRVAYNWRYRRDLTRVKITPNKPYYRPSRYHTSWYEGKELGLVE